MNFDASAGVREQVPETLLADKGFNADAIRADRFKLKIEATIFRQIKPPREDLLRPSALKQRNPHRARVRSPQDLPRIAKHYPNLPTATLVCSISPPPDAGSESVDAT